MLTEKEQLELCKTCTNRGFDSSIGLVCSLTKTRRSFVETCKDYKEDEKEAFKKRQAEQAYQEITQEGNISVWKLVLGLILAAFAVFRLIRNLSQ